MSLLYYLLSPLRLIYQSTVLALGQVWANKVRALLTMIGIIIGVASVTGVIAALTGLRANVLAQFEALGTNRINIYQSRPDTGPKRNASYWTIRLRPSHFDGLLEHCPSVSAFSRMAYRSYTVSYKDVHEENVRVIGVEPAWHEIDNRVVTDGRPLTFIDNEQARPVCLITPSTRDHLRLARDCVGESIVINTDRFVIVGLLQPPPEGGMFGDNGETLEVYIPFNTAWRRFNIFSISAVAASRSPMVSDEAQAELRFFLRNARRLKPDEPDTFRIEVIQQYLERFNSVAIAITAVAGGVVGISLLVGGVGIMNIMLVSVSERTREIGLRKAVGARPAAILLQFLVEAVIICLCGGLLGVFMGYLLTKAIAYIPGAGLGRAYIPAWAIMLSFGFAASVGLIFGMFPAIKAARLDPIEALRHE